MAMINLRELTDDQLNALRAQVDCILRERRDKEKIDAITKFKNTFKYLRKMGVEIYYSEYDDESVELISLDNFEFK